MAQVIKIEIPVEVTDGTEPALSNISGKLSKMEQVMQKLAEQMRNFGKSKMERRTEEEADRTAQAMQELLEEIEELNRANPTVGVGADDNATPVISAVGDAVSNFDGEIGYAEIGADDNATAILRAAEDAVEGFGGISGTAEVGVSDNATPVVRQVEDSVEAVGGVSASAEVGANDNASGIIDAVRDKLNAIGGYAVSAVVGAIDSASEIIDAVKDKASAWAGMTFSATLSVADKVTSPISKAGSALRNPIAQGAAVAGVSFGVADSINTFKDFEATMSQVKAISGAAGADVDALTQKAQQMGATTKFTATESAEAFNYMAMAGWKTGDMLNGIEGIMNLAAASGESLGSTSDIVTDALTAFGLSAGDSTHFADVLAQASANANTNVGMMGESFKYVAPVAGAMHYNIEDTSLALGLMANASIKGSMAGTALKTAIANMAAPTSTMAKAMEQYGISLTDNEGNMKSLRGVMENLRTTLGGLSETEQTAAAEAIFGKEAMAGMLAIINASEEDWDKLTSAVDNADGASKRMADTMMDNLAGSFTLLQSAVDGVKSSLGESTSPYLRYLADWATSKMPGIQEEIAATSKHFDNLVQSMTGTEEWKNADFFGKVNIAWDKLIAEPFMDWAGSDGAHLFSDGIMGLLGSAKNVVTGKAGLTDWLGTAVLARGAVTATKGLISLKETVGALSPVLGKAVPIVGAVAAGVVAIGSAIDSYNQKQINSSLEEHFGNIKLSAEQASEIATQILDAKWVANVELALGELKGADEVRKTAEAALKDNDALEYKNSVGIELTPDEQTAYKENIETFVASKIKELQSRTYSAHLLVGTFLTGKDGQTLADAINSWTLEDTLELNGLSAQLRSAVDEAVSDGMILPDEQKYIDQLQGQINGILSRWKQNQAKAQMDLMRQKYGNLSAEQLESGSFLEVVKDLQEQRTMNEASLDEASLGFYELVHGMDDGRLEKAGLDADSLIAQWDRSILNERSKGLANSVDFETSTLNNAYSGEIAAWKKQRPSGTNAVDYLNSFLNPARDANGKVDMNQVDYSGLTNAMENKILDFYNVNADKGLNSIYEAAKPDISAMADFITSAFDENGNQMYKIPQEVMEKYNEAMQVGAAAGDYDAGMQLMANEIAKSGDQAMIDAIMSGQFGSPEMRSALQIAMAEVGEDMSIDELTATVEGAKIAEESASNVQRSIEEFTNSLNESGSTAEVTADGIQVTLGEVEVDNQSAIEQIAAAVGMSADELAQANGYESAVEVPVGATITVPQENITFDTSSIESAAQTAAEETTPAKIEQEAQANTTVTPGDIDTSQVEEQARSETEETVKDMPVDGNADVDITQTNNSAEVYGEVSGDLKGAFATTIPVSAKASITVDYSVANPSATITFGGAGTGSATVTAAASAEGRYVDAPMLSWIGEDGPEFVIPVGAKRRERGIELWEKAGKALGIPQHADGGIFGVSGSSPAVYIDDSEEDETPSEEKKIGVAVDSGKNSIHVSVSMNPTFEIPSDKPESIVQIIKSQFKEMADDFGNELAERLIDIFSNKPI